MSEFITCDVCNGKGYVSKWSQQHEVQGVACFRCRGYGKLNWVESIFGIQHNDVLFHYPDGSIKETKFEGWVKCGE